MSINKKTIGKLLILVLFLGLITTASYTYSRYVGPTANSVSVGVAKFSVKVNNTDIVENQTFNITLDSDVNTLNNQLAPDEEGYFEVLIDPTGSEVALDYQLTFDVSDIKALSDKIKVKYTVNDVEVTSTGDVVSGSITLPSATSAMTASNKTSVKVCWEWEEEDITNPDASFIAKVNAAKVSASAIVKQKIS